MLKDNGFVESGSQKNFTLWWQIGKVRNEDYLTMKHFQKVNHHPKTSECTRKDKMNQNIANMVARHGKPFDFVPKTYLLPQELSLLLRDADQKRSQKKYYIVKPNCASQGKGIFVTDNLQNVESD